MEGNNASAKKVLETAPLDKGTSDLKVQFSREVFQDLVSKVGLSVSKFSPNEILKHILIDASKDAGVAFVGTDLEISLVARSNIVRVEKEGTVVLPFKDLKSVSDLSDSVVTLEVENGVATIYSDDAVWVCSSVAEDLFPDVVTISDKAIAVPRGGFSRALEFVEPAVCRDETRPSLTMVHLDGTGAFGTDGSRVHYAAFMSDLQELNLALPMIRPLLNLMKAASEDYVYVEVTESKIIFLIGQDEISGRIMDLQFPGVRTSMIDPREKTHTQVIQLSKERMSLAVRRAAQVSDDGAGSVAMRLEAGECVLAAVNMKGSRVATSISLNYSGQARQSLYSIDLIQDALSVVGGDVVNVSMSPSANDGSLLVRDQDNLVVILPRVRS